MEMFVDNEGYLIYDLRYKTQSFDYLELILENIWEQPT